MREREIETSRKTKTPNVKRINEIEMWFRYEYPARLHTINRYTYLGLPLQESRYALELEAYVKENELRTLKGQELLPDIKFKDLI